MTASAAPATALLALGAFRQGQRVRVFTDPTWPAPTLHFGPDRAGIAHSLLTTHPDWRIEAYGDVSEDVKSGKAMPRVTAGLAPVAMGTVAPADRIIRGLEGLGYRVRPKGIGLWRSKCPFGEHERDRLGAYLSIREFADGSSSVKCFSGCTTADILSMIP